MEARTRTRHLLLFGIALLLLGACQPEDDALPEPSCLNGITLAPVTTDTCFEVPKNSFGNPVAFIGDHRRAGMPAFNPRDPSEFVLVLENNLDTILANDYLARVSLCSGEESPIIFFDASNPVPSGFGRLQWGAAGWIAYIAGSSILRVVHADGGSPIDLFTSNSLLEDPTWIAESNHLYFVNKSGGTSVRLIIDMDSGQIVDTLETSIFLNKARFRNGKVAGFTSTREIGFISLQEDVFHSLHQYPEISNDHKPRDIDWLNDYRILWTSPVGIFSIDTETTEVDTIRFTPCENIKYSFTTVSPDEEETRILTTRTEYRYEEGDTLFVYKENVLINVDTDEEWILQLD